MGSFVNKTQRAGSMLRAQGFVELSNDCWDAADYISRLEAVVRAADQLHEHSADGISAVKLTLGFDCGFTKAADGYNAARSRVTIPPLTQTNQAKDGDEEVSDGKA